MALSFHSQAETIVIDGPNGNLVADISMPKQGQDEKSPVVVIMHGFTSSRHDPLILALYDEVVSKGLGAIKFDFDGHGDSGGSFKEMTVPKEIDDAVCIINYVRNLPWVSDIYIVGHSQGGVVASMTAGRFGFPSVAGLALLAPAAVLREDAIRGNLMGVNYDAVNPPESIAIYSGLEVGREYVKTAQKLPIYDTARRYQGPVLMLHGTADIIVPYTYSLRYNEIYSNGSLRLLKGFDHPFSGHERDVAKIVTDFLTETERDYVL